MWKGHETTRRYVSIRGSRHRRYTFYGAVLLPPEVYRNTVDRVERDGGHIGHTLLLVEGGSFSDPYLVLDLLTTHRLLTYTP